MSIHTRSARKVSPTWTFYEGAWREGNHAILGPRTHATWLGSMVFDGARAFEGVTPDLDLHLARVNLSAANMLLDPVVSVEQWRELADDGLRRFADDAQLYIRPMYWAEEGLGGGVRFEPSSTNWCLKSDKDGRGTSREDPGGSGMTRVSDITGHWFGLCRKAPVFHAFQTNADIGFKPICEGQPGGGGSGSGSIRRGGSALSGVRTLIRGNSSGLRSFLGLCWREMPSPRGPSATSPGPWYVYR